MPKRPDPRLFPATPANPSRGSLERALGRTVTAMRNAGQLEPVDELTLAAARYAARLVDELRADPDASGFTAARCLSELGAWHDRLTQLRAGTPGDELDDLLRELSADVGDTGQP